MSRPTRVVVTGAAGQVGVDVVDVLAGLVPPGADASFRPDGRAPDNREFDVLALTRGELDVVDRDAVFRALRAVRPDVIIHLAAYTAVDRAEDDVAKCFAVNEFATESMSLVANDVGAHLITISTDYVFDGLKGSSYVEDDDPRPLSVYGASKYGGELLCSPSDTVVRTSWVMGVRGKSVVHAMIDRAVAGENVRFVSDQRGTVTVASDLARVLATLARERPGGVWHVANAGATTWYEVAVHVGRLLERGEEFATPIATSDLVPAPRAQRPARSDLNTEKFASRWTALPAWTDAVARLVGARRRQSGEPG